VPGLYNVYNALAAAGAAMATGLVDLDAAVAGLARAGAAFGRFERLVVEGRPLVLTLAKNPAGANELIRTLTQDGEAKHLLVALNDRIADGRDVSWVWDVDVERLAPAVAALTATGTRAAELAVRFKYAGLDAGRMQVSPALEPALDRALAAGEGPLYALTTYTAMLELRSILTRRGLVTPYWSAA
jgi:UDP-N-acetylmuramyl tripeptide synthase